MSSLAKKTLAIAVAAAALMVLGWIFYFGPSGVRIPTNGSVGANSGPDAGNRAPSEPSAPNSAPSALPTATKSRANSSKAGTAGVADTPDLASLELQAASGDTDAAVKLANLSNHCHSIEGTLSVLNIHLARDSSADTPQEREQYDRGLEKISESIRKYYDFCRINGEHLIATRLENLLRASQLGDKAMAYCLADSAIDMTGMHLSLDQMEKYQMFSLSFLNDAVDHGDWIAAEELSKAYTPTDYFRKEAASQMVRADPAMAYRYAKLLSLARPGRENAKIRFDENVEALVQTLRPAEIEAGDKWAGMAFSTHFAAHPAYDQGIDCR